MNDCLRHPDLIGEDGDPEGSTRYYVSILHMRISSDVEKVTYYDFIKTNSMFIIEEYTNCAATQIEAFDGVVIKDKDGDYSWFRRIKQENVYPKFKDINGSQE